MRERKEPIPAEVPLHDTPASPFPSPIAAISGAVYAVVCRSVLVAIAIFLDIPNTNKEISKSSASLSTIMITSSMMSP